MTKPECVWTYGGDWDDDYFETSCGEMFSLIDGTPEQNHYHFCPSCGKSLMAVQKERETDND
jgi:rRNA maturation endonuclease Nob1